MAFTKSHGNCQVSKIREAINNKIKDDYGVSI
jgi:hypothetical protein